MAKKLESLMRSHAMAVTQVHENHKLGEMGERERAQLETELRNVENNIKGAFGDAHKLIAQQRQQLNELSAKVRELTPPAPQVEYLPFDPASVKPGDALQVRDNHGAYTGVWRNVQFVCIAPATGLVITESVEHGVALAHRVDRVRVAKRTRELQMFAVVFEGANGVPSGALYAERAERPYMTAPGYKLLADYVPVTITVAE